jgi:hypothetical protein
VNLAVDGWSDSRGRRSQGVTVRLIEHDASVTILLLALKEIKAIHESHRELHLLVDQLKPTYYLQGKVVNICTDRCAMNERALRRPLTHTDPLDDQIWMPCVCHVFNNLLSRFVDRLQDIIKPIFQLQHRFWKNAPFLEFLQQHQAPLEAIPSHSIVRWYGSDALFSALLRLWDHMVAFAEAEHLHIPELSPTGQGQLKNLCEVT